MLSRGNDASRITKEDDMKEYKLYKVFIKRESGNEYAEGPYGACSKIGACVEHLKACGSKTRKLNGIPKNYRVEET